MNETKKILDFMIEYYKNKNNGWMLRPEFRTAVGFEGGETYIDLLAVNPYYNKRTIVCFEIKISMSDFKRDIENFGEKHAPVLEFTNEFYYLLSEKIIKKDTVGMIPAECGLCTIKNNKLKILKKAPFRKTGDISRKYLMAFLQNFFKEQQIIPYKYRDKELTSKEFRELVLESCEDIINKKVDERSKIRNIELIKEFEEKNKFILEKESELKELKRKILFVTNAYDLDKANDKLYEFRRRIDDVKEIENKMTVFINNLISLKEFLNNNKGEEVINSFIKFLKGEAEKNE